MIRAMRTRDFLLAAFCCSVSLIVAAYAYASIRQIEKPKTVVIQRVREGTERYKILSGAQCPGDFSVTMMHDAVWGIKAEGHLKTSYGKQIVDAKLDSEALFNPLGQLNSAHLTVEADNYTVTVQLTNPHPITVDVQATGNGPQFSQQFSIPGPVLINRNPDGSYHVDYAYLPIDQDPALRTVQGFLGKQLNLSMVSESTAPDCDAGGEARLDLLPLIARSQSLLGPLLALTSGAANQEQRR